MEGLKKHKLFDSIFNTICVVVFVGWVGAMASESPALMIVSTVLVFIWYSTMKKYELGKGRG